MSVRFKQGCDRTPNILSPILPESLNMIKRSSNIHEAGCKRTPQKMTESLFGGVCLQKPIHNHCDGAKGSIICFPCSQKFMSYGLASGIIHYRLDSCSGPPGGEPSREAQLSVSQIFFHRFLFFFNQKRFCSGLFVCKDESGGGQQRKL